MPFDCSSSCSLLFFYFYNLLDICWHLHLIDGGISDTSLKAAHFIVRFNRNCLFLITAEPKPIVDAMLVVFALLLDLKGARHLYCITWRDFLIA